ncbi:MAG: glycosyltransferase family 39 protein [Pyrinomonadaceae bacterium]|nr:glycosyltransferase family 39 protein [Pyrinomonadaceae bacterium]
MFVKICRTLLFGSAASLAVWAAVDPRFRNLEGFPSGRICLPMAGGVALALLALAIGTTWQRFVWWFSLALVGQALALQLIEAGNLIRYQHYRTFRHLLTGTHFLLLILLVSQSFFVLFGVARRWSTIRGWLQKSFRLWQLLAVVAVFVLTSAALSRDVSIYVGEVIFASFVQTVNVCNLVLLAWAFPESWLEWFRQKLQVFETGETRTNLFLILSAIWVTLLSAFLAYFFYERHPHIPDEVIYVEHARYLAARMLTMPAPPVPAAFNIFLMSLEGGRWYAVPPFGWPAVLSVGVWLGVPWLVNPLLAGLNVLLAYALASELFDRRVARWIVLLLCVSPWHIFMAMNFMTHTVTFTCALVATLGVAWARKTGKTKWALLAGAFIGLASLIRPLDGLMLAGLLGLWSIGAGGRRLKLAHIAALVLATAIIGSISLAYNRHLTGDPTANPLIVYSDKQFGPGSNGLGFGPNKGLGTWAIDPFPGHSPLDAAVNSNLNLFSLNIELLGWSIGSLLLIAAFSFSRALKRADYLMLVAISVVFTAHIFYWYSGGPDFGARYWFLMLFPCLALTARGIQFFESTLDANSHNQNHRRVAIAVLSLCLISLVNYVPWRALDKYHHFLRMRPDVRYLAKEHGFGKSLVLIRGDEHPDYASAFTYNPLSLQADEPVYAWDRGPALTSQLLQVYKDRPIWIINGPSITGRGYEIIDGPLTAQGFLAAKSERR